MKIFSFIVVWIFTLVISFYAGSRIGTREHIFADSQYRAALVVANIRRIEKGQVDYLKDLYEVELNMHIARHGDYLDSKFKWLWPELQPETSRAIKTAVDYRIKYPFKEPDFANPKNREPHVFADDSFLLEVIEGQKQNQRQIEKVLKEYPDDDA